MILLTQPALVSAQDRQPAPPNSPAGAQAAQPAPTVDQILDLYVQALGGKEAIQRVSRRVIKGTFTSPDLQADGTFEISAKAPNKQLVVLQAADFGTFRQGFNGTAAWQQQPGSDVEDQPTFPKREADFYLPIKLHELFPKLALVGREKVGARQAVVLEAPRAGNPKRWYFDAEGRLLIRTENRTPEGKVVESEDFDDYRAVDGIKMPFSIRHLEDEGITLQLKVTDVKHNVEIDDAKFEKPAPPKKDGAAATTAPQAPPALRQKTFEIVWRTVNEKHYDPNHNGVDWAKIHEQYAPRVKSVKNDEEFYTLLNQMLGELHQSPHWVMSPKVLEAMRESHGGVGIKHRLVADLDGDLKRLPTGALLLYAFAECRTPKGVVIEGRGVTPDVEVKLTRAALLKGGDPQLQAAVGEVRKKLL